MTIFFMIYIVLIWIHTITTIYLLCFLRIIVRYSYSLLIYHVLYLIIFKIYVSIDQIHVVSDTRIVFVPYKQQ